MYIPDRRTQLPFFVSKTEVPDHAEFYHAGGFSQRSRSSTSRCFQGYCLAISPARQPTIKFSAAGAAW